MRFGKFLRTMCTLTKLRLLWLAKLKQQPLPKVASILSSSRLCANHHEAHSGDRTDQSIISMFGVEALDHECGRVPIVWLVHSVSSSIREGSVSEHYKALVLFAMICFFLLCLVHNHCHEPVAQTQTWYLCEQNVNDGLYRKVIRYASITAQ